jgi:hypothetical protein
MDYRRSNINTVVLVCCVHTKSALQVINRILNNLLHKRRMCLHDNAQIKVVCKVCHYKLQTSHSVRIPFRNLKEEPECLLTKQVLAQAMSNVVATVWQQIKSMYLYNPSNTTKKTYIILLKVLYVYFKLTHPIVLEYR